MNVSDAVQARTSVRAYLDKPVELGLINKLLATAGRAPSGGNLQPWHVHALTGQPLRDLLDTVARNGPDENPAYAIYPSPLGEPYRSRRFQIGEALYSTLQIARDDKAGRLTQLARNAQFFGAPVGIFILIDRTHGSPQWADLGMFMQTLMLLAAEHGLDTCSQEYWSLYSSSVEKFLNLPDNLMVFCGMALGYRDPAAPINTLQSPRAPLAEWCCLHGFEG